MLFRSAFESISDDCERILDEVDDIEQLERYLNDVGSGYLRLRMLDKIQLLKKKEG